MKIQIAAVTDVGKERTNNEDAYITCPDLLQQAWTDGDTSAYLPLGEYGALLIVADGMGGANAGEVASSIAVSTIRQSFSAENIRQAIGGEGIDKLLTESVRKADEVINDRIDKDPETMGMGTTIVVCWLLGDTAHIAWCGDSRCYLFNPHRGMTQLTKDHSYVQELVDKGEITEEAAFTHPDNNIITRGLGDVNCQCEPDITSCHYGPGDIFLLCSDGLCGYSTNSDIAKILIRNCQDIGRCRDALLQQALDAGGFDNICIALASVISDNQNAPSAPSFMQRIIMKLKMLMHRF